MQEMPLVDTRTQAVFGAGNADAELMFIGEAPGAEEDRQGLPFVGRAGRLLNRLRKRWGSRATTSSSPTCSSPRRRATAIPSRWRSRPAAVPVRAGAPDRAARRLHPRQLRHQAAQRQPDRDHQGAGDAAGARAGRAHVFLLPLFHPAAALRTPAVKETLRGDFATCRSCSLGPPAAPTRRAEELAERRPKGRPPPPADQLDLFG